ncbi:serine hydrolase domain-containing protein [Nocardia sp. JCM 34519.1]|uniref:serine hydrolase domain-containing protein n=1 Tax=unclassified Nocardia TaxID=2637762 RepID=UPI0035A891AB
MVPMNGACDDRFACVRDAFEKTLTEGEGGASAAVFIDGEPVVDLWGGHADRERTRPWERDTLVNVWSTSKTMTNLCALILADQGAIDLYAPVSKYWPEFAAAGKADVQVRHLLSHTSGLAGWDRPLRAPEQIYDWELCTSLLAAQAPWWEPGTKSGYHVLSQGFLVGEVIRRVTGHSVATFFREQVAGPLGADFHFGLPAEHDHRVSNAFRTHVETLTPEQERMRAKVIGEPDVLDHPEEIVSTRQWRAADIPAGNGHGNARSVATIQSVLACGGQARGVRLLSEHGCRAVFDQQSDGRDLILDRQLRFGMGYALAEGELPMAGPRTCYWGGAGGSLVYLDLDARMVVAYVMNHMISTGGLNTTGDNRATSLVIAAYNALGAESRTALRSTCRARAGR